MGCPGAAQSQERGSSGPPRSEMRGRTGPDSASSQNAGGTSVFEPKSEPWAPIFRREVPSARSALRGAPGRVLVGLLRIPCGVGPELAPPICRTAR